MHTNLLQVPDLAVHLPVLRNRRCAKCSRLGGSGLRLEPFTPVVLLSSERLHGEERKAFQVPAARLNEVTGLLHAFESVRIDYPEDSSVFGWEDGHPLKYRYRFPETYEQISTRLPKMDDPAVS